MSLAARPLWLGLLVALVLVLLRPPSVYTGYDSAVYTLVGSEMLQGRALYVELQDQKGPLVYLFFAALYGLFGFNPVLLSLVTSLWSVGEVLLIAALGARLLGRGAFWPVALAGAYLTLFPLGQRFNSEHLLVPLMAGGALLAARAWQGGSWWPALLGGALGGLAFFTRPTAAADLAAVGLALLLSSRGAERARGLRVFAAALAGLVAAVGAGLGVMAAAGILGGFGRCVFGLNLGYLAGETLAGGSLSSGAVQAVTGILMPTAPYWLLAGVGLALLWPRPGQEPTPGGRLTVPLLGLWALFAGAQTALGGHFYPHYFLPLLPATAILAGAALCRLLGPEVGERQLGRGLAWGLLLVAVLSLLPRVGPAVHKWEGLVRGGQSALWEDRLGQALAAQGAQPGEMAFTWPFLPHVYLWSGTRPASRLVNTLVRPWPPVASWPPPPGLAVPPASAAKLYRQRGDYAAWEADMAARPPVWVLLVRTEASPEEQAAYRYLRAWTAARGYRQVATAENAEIWRRLR